MWKRILWIILLPISLPAYLWLRWRNARLRAKRDQLRAEMEKRGDKLSEEDKRQLAELRARLWPDGDVPPDCRPLPEGTERTPVGL